MPDSFDPEAVPPNAPIWNADLTDPAVDYRAVVLGTSISWGQGLWPEEKACVLATRAFAALQGRQRPVVASYAQSGARLWPASMGAGNQALLGAEIPFLGLSLRNPLAIPNNNVIKRGPLRMVQTSPHAAGSANMPMHVRPFASRNLSALDGETPWHGAPYIWDQADQAKTDFAGAGVRPDLIWMDIGANDVNFIERTFLHSPVLNPVERHLETCLDNLEGSLRSLLDALITDPHLGGCPIVVTGYYHAVTPYSFSEYAVLDSPCPLIDFALNNPILRQMMYDFRVQNAVVHNMDMFVQLINAWLHDVVTDAARTHGANIRLAVPPFPPNSGIFVEDTALVWPRATMPFDSLHGHREGNMTSWAHPNPRGAEIFADAAVDVMSGA